MLYNFSENTNFTQKQLNESWGFLIPKFLNLENILLQIIVKNVNN